MVLEAVMVTYEKTAPVLNCDASVLALVLVYGIWLSLAVTSSEYRPLPNY